MWPGNTRRAARSLRPSASRKAVSTAKQGLRNSLGCTDINGNAIQRRAPLMSTPCTSVQAVARRASAQPTIAVSRTWRGVSIEVPTTIRPASARNTTCLRMNMSRDAPIRIATAGEAASTST